MEEDVEKGDTIFTSEHSRHLFYPFPNQPKHSKDEEDGHHHHPPGFLPPPSHHNGQELQIFKKPDLSEQTHLLQHKPKLPQSHLDFRPMTLQAPMKPIHKPREIIITPRKLPQSPLYKSQVPPSYLTFPDVTTPYTPDTDSDKEIAEAPIKQFKKPREIIIKPHKTLNSVSKPTRKRHLLSNLAIRKHIHPECNTNDDAIDISEERDRFSRTDTNHVFKISPTDFEEIESVTILRLNFEQH